MLTAVKSWFSASRKSAQAARPARRIRLETESLETREVPAGLNFYGITGLAYPGPTNTYAAQVQANQQVANYLHQNLFVPMQQQVVSGIPGYGFSQRMTNYMVNQLSPLVGQHSILDGTTLTPQAYRAATSSITSGANSLGYILNPAGYTNSLMTLGGMGNVASLTGGPQSYQTIMNDPVIGLTSGYLPYQSMLSGLQRFDGLPNGQINPLGAGVDIGLGGLSGGGGVLGNLALLGQISHGYLG